MHPNNASDNDNSENQTRRTLESQTPDQKKEEPTKGKTWNTENRSKWGTVSIIK